MNGFLKMQVLSLLIYIALLMATLGCGNKYENNNQIRMVSSLSINTGNYPYSYLDEGSNHVQNLVPNGKSARLIFSVCGELRDETSFTNKFTDIDRIFKIMLFKNE